VRVGLEATGETVLPDSIAVIRPYLQSTTRSATQPTSIPEVELAASQLTLQLSRSRASFLRLAFRAQPDQADLLECVNAARRVAGTASELLCDP
jgi:hypothetical protein